MYVCTLRVIIATAVDGNYYNKSKGAVIINTSDDFIIVRHE